MPSSEGRPPGRPGIFLISYFGSPGPMVDPFRDRVSHFLRLLSWLPGFLIRFSALPACLRFFLIPTQPF